MFRTSHKLLVYSLKVSTVGEEFLTAIIYFTAMLRKLSLQVLGFRDEDIPIEGFLLPIGQEQYHMRHGCSSCLGGSFANKFAIMNPRLLEDKGFIKLLQLIGTILCVRNPYDSTRSASVLCHPLIVFVKIPRDDFSGILCVHGLSYVATGLVPAWWPDWHEMLDLGFLLFNAKGRFD